MFKVFRVKDKFESNIFHNSCLFEQQFRTLMIFFTNLYNQIWNESNKNISLKISAWYGSFCSLSIFLLLLTRARWISITELWNLYNKEEEEESPCLIKRMLDMNERHSNRVDEISIIGPAWEKKNPHMMCVSSSQYEHFKWEGSYFSFCLMSSVGSCDFYEHKFLSALSWESIQHSI